MKSIQRKSHGAEPHGPNSRYFFNVEIWGLNKSDGGIDFCFCEINPRCAHAYQVMTWLLQAAPGVRNQRSHSARLPLPSEAHTVPNRPLPKRPVPTDHVALRCASGISHSFD